MYSNMQKSCMIDLLKSLAAAFVKMYKEFEKAGAHVDKCPSVSGKVAKWCVEIILEEKLKKV